MRSALELWIPNPVSVCLYLPLTPRTPPSIPQNQTLCKSADSSSALFRCLVLSLGGILRGTCVHITLLPHVRQERLVCTLTKVLVIFIVACCFCEWCFFFPLWCFLLFILCRLSLSLSVWGFSIYSNPTSWWFPLPLCQWMPLTEAAGSDVW